MAGHDPAADRWLPGICVDGRRQELVAQLATVIFVHLNCSQDRKIKWAY
jgi:hypothetical protein